MRTMNLPEVPIGSSSLDGCVQLYRGRIVQDQSPMPRLSVLLTAYMAWPNNESERDSFAATYAARSAYSDTPPPATDRLRSPSAHLTGLILRDSAV